MSPTDVRSSLALLSSAGNRASRAGRDKCFRDVRGEAGRNGECSVTALSSLGLVRVRMLSCAGHNASTPQGPGSSGKVVAQQLALMQT